MNSYFDNAATSWPKPELVYRAVDECLRNLPGSPGRTAGGSGDRLLFDVRNLIARLFNIRDSSRIILTFNSTMSLNLAIQGLLKPGDRVVTGSMEHNAVSRPLKALENNLGIRLDVIRASPDGYLDPDDLRRTLCLPAKLVVINHGSNVCGSLQPIEAIGRIVRDSGAWFMLDASQSAGAVPIDVERHCIDILAAPGHKSLLGPTGTGFCYLGPGIDPEPLMFGGTGSQSERDTQPLHLPDRYESGTLNFHGLAGLRAALGYLLDRGPADIERCETELNREVLSGLQSIEGIELIGPVHNRERLPVFSIVCPGKDPADLSNILSEDFDIATRVGLHCAPWAHRTLGTYPGGTVRISPGLFHTDPDIRNLLDSLDQAVRKLSR